MADTPLIEMRGIVKTFPGVRALDGVDLTLRRGEVHTLMGENGAGKSTLVKVLTGVHRRDGGSIHFKGQPIDPASPLDAQRLGIATVYQEVNLVPDLSVAENISIGREPRRMGLIDWRAVRRRGEEAMARLGVSIDVRQSVRSCSIAIQQMVAIARALDQNASVLVLDEPTSSLDTAEVAELFTVMRRLRGEGLAIVFISHFLEQVYAISDRLTVLRNGKLIGEYAAAKLPRLQLVSKMIGRELEAVERMEQRHATPATTTETPVVLEAKGLGRRHSVTSMDLQMRAGQVVGLAGLLGSGRTETARLIFGIDAPQEGSITIDGKPMHRHTPRAAIRHCIAFTPEDRKVQGIVPELSVRANIVLALQARRGWLRRIGSRDAEALAERFIKALNIATPDADKPVGQLSGGNQQKVILARWLAMDPRVLILDEPTRGIDVGAKAEIEKLIASLCQRGMALLFISSEIEEVARDSHRVIVLRDRKKVGELTGGDITLPKIMQFIAARHAESADA
ncbi:MAG: ATP-binding cassette domain-containing protein [Planctomycetes bacterium]|nr:ATP-binding cassette domain-containing protein [Planctomycetota bacterium]